MFARVVTNTTQVSLIDGISVVSTCFGQVYLGMKTSSENVYIVSAMVLSAIKNSTIPFEGVFVSPNIGSAIRDKEGRIIGVPGFTK